MRPVFEKFGLGVDRIVARSWEEALAAGEGSGYFAPQGHPGNSYATASIQYDLASSGGSATPAYRRPGDRELAEIVLPGKTGAELAGLGVERLAMALGDAFLDL